MDTVSWDDYDIHVWAEAEGGWTTWNVYFAQFYDCVDWSRKAKEWGESGNGAAERGRRGDMSLVVSSRFHSSLGEYDLEAGVLQHVELDAKYPSY